MYLGIDIIPTQKGFYVLETNLGVPGGLTDIVEGTMHFSPLICRKTREKSILGWTEYVTKLFSLVDDLSKIYYDRCFSDLVKSHPAMKDLKISKDVRRQLKPIPKNLSRWVYFADKCYFFEFLKSHKTQNFLIPETYTALNKKSLLRFGNIILSKGKKVIIKPAQLWHGIGVVKINNYQELIKFKATHGYPVVVQEAISSNFLKNHFDMRLIIMCGHLIGVLIRVAVGKSVISNISAGGRVILCFPSSKNKGLIFKNITSKFYTRNYYTEWEKILLEDFHTFHEKKSTVYDKRICFIGHYEWNILNKLAKEIYCLMALDSGKFGIVLPSKRGDHYLNKILNGRFNSNN